MSGYVSRVIDAELDELLSGLAAIAIEGPKGIGKTETATRRAQTAYELDDSAQRELLAADPYLLRTIKGTVLVDEWQRFPEVWDVVRRSVDADPTPGRFLLTGSAVPSEAPVHSGAGRIVSLRMRPMSIYERELAEPTVSLETLLNTDRPKIAGECTVGLADYAEEIVRSGFPGIRVLSGRSQRAQLDSYITRIVEREFPKQGLIVRKPSVLRQWLRAYAAATSLTTSYSVILDAATPGEDDKPAKTTTLAYRDVLADLWILDPLPGWVPARNPFARLAQAPKHNLADPGLAARLLGLDRSALITGKPTKPAVRHSGTMLGQLFESLVTLSLRVYAQSAEATVHHLRTRNGNHEIDQIIERPDGSIIAVETKLAATVSDADVKHLHWLAKQLGDDLIDSVIITTGRYAYRRADGIAVVPACLLGP